MLHIEGLGTRLRKYSASINADTKIQAKTFIKDLSEDDIDNDDALGKFTFIGKRVLKRLLRQVATVTAEQQLFSLLLILLHLMIVFIGISQY